MRHAPAAILALLALAMLSAACDDGLGLGPVMLDTDTLTLSAPTAATGFATAVDLLGANSGRFPEQLSDAGRWDFGVRQSGAAFTLVPFRSATAGSSVAAGAFRATGPLGSIDIAPTRRSAYGLTEPFAIAEGEVYVARSRLGVGPFNLPCQKFSKFQVLELDGAAGTARILFVTNRECNDDRLAEDD